MEIPDSIAAEKQELRRALMARRDAMPAAGRDTASAAIMGRLLRMVEIDAAHTVFCFISSGTEVHTHDLLAALHKRGKILLVPKILRGEPMRAVEFRGWDSLEPGTLGILAPKDSTPYAGTADVVLTPGLGFTPDGRRLGYGKGYYDRWFATHRHGARIGVAFQCQLVESLPTSPTDIAVHRVVTEQDSRVPTP